MLMILSNKRSNSLKERAFPILIFLLKAYLCLLRSLKVLIFNYPLIYQIVADQMEILKAELEATE